MVSLRLKIIITFTICAVSGFCFFLYIISQEVEPRMREAVEEVLVENAYSLATVVENKLSEKKVLSTTMLESLLNKNDKPALNAKIYNFKKTNLDLRIYVCDAKGKVLYHSYDKTQIGVDYSKWNDVYRSLHGIYGARTTRDNPEDPTTSVLYVAAPIYYNGKIIAVLTVGKPATHNNYFVNTAKYELYLFGFLLAFLGLIFSWSVTLWVSRPIAKLRAYVKALKAGLEPALPYLGNNEISQLAHTLYEMKNSLEGRQHIQHYVQSLSHELKSPLSSIVGASELLLEHKFVKAEGQKFLENIDIEAKRMEDLINSLLELSNLESLAEIKHKEKVNLSKLLQECINQHKILLKHKELKFNLELGRDIYCVVDRLLISLAINNIINNAIEFSPKKSTITVSITANESVQIRISDQGPGIPDWAIDKIFTQFFSLPRPDSGRKSTGLGLAIARKIARLHGGECSIISSTDLGTCFELRLRKIS